MGDKPSRIEPPGAGGSEVPASGHEVGRRKDVQGGGECGQVVTEADSAACQLSLERHLRKCPRKKESLCSRQ